MEQLSLDMPVQYEVGQTVWWTHGLGFLVATYEHGGKVRPESTEMVRIESVNEVIPLYSDGSISNRTMRIYSFEDDREYHVHPRWLSHDQNIPCEAVLEANGIYL